MGLLESNRYKAVVSLSQQSAIADDWGTKNCLAAGRCDDGTGGGGSRGGNIASEREWHGWYSHKIFRRCFQKRKHSPLSRSAERAAVEE